MKTSLKQKKLCMILYKNQDMSEPGREFFSTVFLSNNWNLLLRLTPLFLIDNGIQLRVSIGRNILKALN